MPQCTPPVFQQPVIHMLNLKWPFHHASTVRVCACMSVSQAGIARGNEAAAVEAGLPSQAQFLACGKQHKKVLRWLAGMDVNVVAMLGRKHLSDHDLLNDKKDGGLGPCNGCWFVAWQRTASMG